MEPTYHMVVKASSYGVVVTEASSGMRAGVGEVRPAMNL
jgi:hypothetical protein